MRAKPNHALKLYADFFVVTRIQLDIMRYIVIKTIEITMAKRSKRNYEAFFNQASSVLQKFVFIKGVDKG